MTNSVLTFLFLIGVLVIAVGLIAVIALVRRTPKGIDAEEYREKWMRIERSLSDDTNALRMAIINADALLDKALKARGFKGSSTGERMCAASRQFTKRDAVWGAHKLRNAIAHEETVQMNMSLCRRALASYKQALRDIGVLQ